MDVFIFTNLMKAFRVRRFNAQLSHTDSQYHIVRSRSCRTITASGQQSSHRNKAKDNATSPGYVIHAIRSKEPEAVTFAQIYRSRCVEISQQIQKINYTEKKIDLLNLG